MANERKVAVVTGGSSGIGLATAKRLVSDGLDVVICGRDEEKLAASRREMSTIREGACHGWRADLAVSGEAAGLIERVREQFGRLDVLVNNAGYAPCAGIEEISEDEYEACTRVKPSAVKVEDGQVACLLYEGAQ